MSGRKASLSDNAGNVALMDVVDFPDELLPPGIRSRFVANVNGLRMHILEAGYETGDRPVVLLLHGFPELAWSWRKVMPALAAAGFHVVAPDQRGYGRTTGWDGAYDGDLASFRALNLVQDLLDLVFALGNRHVRAVVGHDFGSPIAAHCALIRPDVFTSLVMMSAPFGGPPPAGAAPAQQADIHSALAGLTPARKHYQWYYSTRQADGDMLNAPQGLHAFLRAYYHVKSADWPGNQPHPLRAWSAEELTRLPPYYVMPAEAGMAETVAPYMPSEAEIAACSWLTEPELDVSCAEFARTGFQGGLQWYRCLTSGLAAADLRLFAGCTINVPATFIAGAADWGTYQSPGLFERLDRACTDLRGRHLVAAAGHWVQQEQAPAVSELLRDFLAH
ncbi:MAG: alpha/beta hydrolase [Actinomycetia bacterium]|nr:alpha/beta hydrolase [Actinomycetes bacterium]